MSHTHEFTPDPSREERCGFSEVIYAEGKTPEQVVNIALELLETSDVVLATRANEEHVSHMRAWFGEELQWFERARLMVVDRRSDGIGVAAESSEGPYELEAIIEGRSGGIGNVVVCCAGTSDLPVAEEATIAARVMGSKAQLLGDVGVAGVHRILNHQDLLHNARAIIAVAGMEGALPTLVAGLVDVPVIAVPTSVGYGASFGGLSALLGMLNSCAGGVSVVNIDNGFGAAQVADRINRPPARFNPDLDGDQMAITELVHDAEDEDSDDEWLFEPSTPAIDFDTDFDGDQMGRFATQELDIPSFDEDDDEVDEGDEDLIGLPDFIKQRDKKK